jgi:hypothetical protein
MITLKRKITLTMQPDPQDGNLFTVVALDDLTGITGGSSIDVAAAIGKGSRADHMILAATRGAVRELLVNLTTQRKIEL